MNDMREMAKQLRLPEGENAAIVTELMANGNRSLYENTFKQMELFSGACVLEIGPANGHFVKQLFEMNPAINYDGVDLSRDMVSEAKKVNSDLVEANKAEFVYGNVDDLPFADELFDVVFTVNTIYFWPDIKKGMSEITRVLKKGGKIIISIRSKESMLKMPFTEFGFEMFSKADMEKIFTESRLSETAIRSFEEEISLPNNEKRTMESYCCFGRKV